MKQEYEKIFYELIELSNDLGIKVKEINGNQIILSYNIYDFDIIYNGDYIMQQNYDLIGIYDDLEILLDDIIDFENYK